MSKAELAKALESLSTFRTRKTRASYEVVEKGIYILENDGLKQMGDEVWAFLEQLAIAAMDVGQLELADDCITRVLEKFPDSPRVDVLQGIRIEVTGNLDQAIKYYEAIMDTDESNIAVAKRLVSIYRAKADYTMAISLLSHTLDTFYTDPEGWLELSDMYASCGQYTYSLQSLTHAMLLAPQNPFYVLQAAETAYTDADLPLAIKLFLRVVELTEDVKEGVARRAWFGVKSCANRLLNEPKSPSASETAIASSQHLKLLEELATEQLLSSYSGGAATADPDSRKAVVKWLS